MIQDQNEMIRNPAVCMVAYWRYYGVAETCNCNSCVEVNA